MNVEDKKQERSKAKMAVTVAARRLIGAYNRDCEYDILKDSMFELEKVFDDFCVINEEYELIVSDEKYAEHRVVNGEDIRTYRDNVKRCYQEARSVFVSVKATIEQKARQQSAGPVKVALKNDICRIRELITVVDESFKLDNVNIGALQLDKSDLQSILNIICDNMAKLGSIETQEQVNLIQEEVDAIIRAVYNCIRKINLFLHEQQAFVKSLHIENATLPPETNTPPENTETINTMSPPGDQHQHPPEDTETINTMSPPGNQHQHPPENTETINTMTPPEINTNTPPEDTETINTMSSPKNQHPPETISTTSPLAIISPLSPFTLQPTLKLLTPLLSRPTQFHLCCQLTLPPLITPVPLAPKLPPTVQRPTPPYQPYLGPVRVFA